MNFFSGYVLGLALGSILMHAGLVIAFLWSFSVDLPTLWEHFPQGGGLPDLYHAPGPISSSEEHWVLVSSVAFWLSKWLSSRSSPFVASSQNSVIPHQMIERMRK